MDSLPNVSLTNITLCESGLTGYRENGLECKITANLLLRPLLPPKWPLELLTAGGVTPLARGEIACEPTCVRYAQTFNGDKKPPAAINHKIMRENPDTRIIGATYHPFFILTSYLTAWKWCHWSIYRTSAEHFDKFLALNWNNMAWLILMICLGEIFIRYFNLPTDLTLRN